MHVGQWDCRLSPCNLLCGLPRQRLGGHRAQRPHLAGKQFGGCVAEPDRLTRASTVVAEYPLCRAAGICRRNNEPATRGFPAPRRREAGVGRAGPIVGFAQIGRHSEPRQGGRRDDRILRAAASDLTIALATCRSRRWSRRVTRRVIAFRSARPPRALAQCHGSDTHVDCVVVAVGDHRTVCPPQPAAAER